MTIGAAELEEIVGFVRRFAPFSGLPERELQRTVAAMSVSYFRRGARVTAAGDANGWLSVVRSGAVDLKLGGTDLTARAGEGDCFGYPSLIRRGPAQNEAIAIEDCLLYRLPAESFYRLWDNEEAFRHFFELDEAARLRRAVGSLRRDAGAGSEEQALGIHVKLGDIAGRRELVSGTADMTIGAAADLMAQLDVSVLPIHDGSRLVGILTDKDLRRRVLAKRLDLATPLREVMTPDPITVPEDETVLTALLEMTARHIRHLPVEGSGGEIVGIISSSDVLAHLGSNTFHVAREVETAPDVATIVQASGSIPRAVVGLVDAGVDADHVARYVSSIGEIAHRRILSLAEQELGPPPVPYALVGFGSLARSELSLGSDQDNGFVFGDGFVREEHDAYFSQLGQRLADGLDSAGYRYCPGDIMASNPTYRRTTGEWTAHFRSWIDSPDPQAILESGIFFDMRAIGGDAALVATMRRDIFAAASENRIFLSFIARAAAASAVPLGFFRNFLLQHDSEEGDVFDLKAQAITPIIDIARTHAIAMGATETGTLARLKAAGEDGRLDPEVTRDLIACFEFVRDVRFRHQAEQIRHGKPPTNKLDPAELSRFDREHLRDAFKLIREQLDRLRSKYAGGLT